ncbi:MAG: cytochrome C oxidase subunit IV family protein [Fimbriimonadaceae bacterium]|nr:cytochrome C oxidase subunit IV family protein [Chitinophagales bacterium]
MSTLSPDAARQRVWKVCRILGYVTIFEVAAALIYFYFFKEDVPKLLVSSLFIILSALKAYFIMSEFMHLKYELKAMTLTILTPFLFLVWGVIAFLWEGEYWLSLKELWR